MEDTTPPLVSERTGAPIDPDALIGTGDIVVFPEVPEDEEILPTLETDLDGAWSSQIVLTPSQTTEELLPPADDPADVIELPPIEPGDQAIAFELIPHLETIVDKTIRDAAVREYIDLVKVHKVPGGVAANRIGRKYSASRYVKSALGQLLADYHATAEIDRAVVRAGRRKILIDALHDNDRKSALTVMKQIADDPDVGLAAPPTVALSMDLTGLEALLASVSAEKVIDLPDGLRETEV